MKRRAATALVAVGLVSMVGQVVLLRELAVASFGIELVFVAGTALWLAAGAAGALLPAGGDPWRALARGLLALAVLLPCEVAFLRGARILFGGVPGAYLPLGRELATAALGLVPTGVLLGALFRSGARAMAGSGGTLAAAYGWESLGGALGCAASTAAFPAGASSWALALAGAAAGAGAAAVLRRDRRPAALLVTAALAVIALAAPALDRWTTGWSHPSLALARDTPYGRIALVEAEGELTVFENDALAWSSGGTEAEGLVHPAALQVGAGARVLVLEGGLYGVAAEVRKHRPARVDLVLLNGALARALGPRLPAEARAALEDPAARLRVADPRAFLASSPDLYDLVVVGASEPSSGQANRLYTAEFYRACAARLAPGGVLALRLPSLENRWTPGLLLRNGAVHAALRSAFQDVLVLPGATDVLLASQAPLVRDPAVLGERLRARGIASREITPEGLRWLLTNDRVATAASLLAGAGAAPNTDDRPVCYQQTALLWLGKLLGGPQDARLPGPRAAWAALGVAAALALAARASRRLRPWALVAVASFAAMALEAAALLRYQSWSGALYRDLGVLFTAFMVGLAAGAGLVARAVAAGRGGARAWGMVPLAALTIASAGLAAVPRVGLGLGLLLGAATLATAGAAVAILFGHASRMGREESGAGGALYAADLLGGCAGSLVAGGLLVLVLGIDGTALAAAGLALAALVLVV